MRHIGSGYGFMIKRIMYYFMKKKRRWWSILREKARFTGIWQKTTSDDLSPTRIPVSIMKMTPGNFEMTFVGKLLKIRVKYESVYMEISWDTRREMNVEVCLCGIQGTGYRRGSGRYERRQSDLVSGCSHKRKNSPKWFRGWMANVLCQDWILNGRKISWSVRESTCAQS